ncbi:Di-glucose binding within endoplasmic reticulum [Haladaptatus paucihalophilus DX253]|uniref:Di-glucose binding within endoplasmic reticulum n=2 Tax=Haladaptatus paucihalophilus DX253 TaxID=797209 RepID=A0A1M6SGJ6_HALPU|nr:Di-glucose binding within endoplasmic reticulum [Haladaptatus paucihalophilus DX253]
MRNMSGSSSGGFIHGILIGGGVVFFVAGILIVTGVPGGVLQPASGGANDSTSTPVETTQTTPTATTTTAAQTTQTTRTTSTTTRPSTTTAQTTTTTQTTTATTAPSKTVRYRVNVGGRWLSSSDTGPNWLEDSENDPVRFGNARVSGSHTNGTNDPIAMTPAVPAGTPEAMFQSRRYDADTKNDRTDDTEMQYRFPVRSGKYEVRLYFAETYLGNSGWNDHKKEGPREFDVEIEGNRVLHKYNMYKELGHDRGTMKSYTVTVRDGTLNVKFLHRKEDPMLSGIEIVRVNDGNVNNSRDGSDGTDGWSWSRDVPTQPLAAVTDSGFEPA